MKKAIASFLLALLCLSVGAQENYEAALEAYIKTSPNSNNMSSEMLKPTLYSINQRVLADFSKEKSDELIKDYLAQQWQKDVIHGLKPLYEKHLTLDELKELTTLLATEQGQRFLRNYDQFTHMAFTECEELVERYFKALQSGRKAKPVRIDKACPTIYTELFGTFYEGFHLQNIVSQFLHMAIDTETANEEEEANMNGAADYITENMKTLLINNSYKVLTEEDLRYGILVSQTTGWEHQLSVVDDLPAHSQSLGKALINGYLAWLQKQNVKLKR